MRTRFAESLLLGSILLAGSFAAHAESQWNSLPLQSEEDQGWTPQEVSDGDVDTYTVYRAVTTVEKIVVQREPLKPRYAIALGRLTGVESTNLCPETNLVAVPDLNDIEASDNENSRERMLTWQMLDAAKLAYTLGNEVAVVIDRERFVRNTKGCERATLLRIAPL